MVILHSEGILDRGCGVYEFPKIFRENSPVASFPRHFDRKPITETSGP